MATTRILPFFGRLNAARLTVTCINRVQTWRNYSDMALTFASPAEAFYTESKVQQVDVPSTAGDMGILPNHVPLLGVLRPGVVTVYAEDGSQNKIFVSSGTVTVNADSSVQILAEEATPVSRLDVQAIHDGLAKAQQSMASATSDRKKAEAQVAVECYEALNKAVTGK